MSARKKEVRAERAEAKINGMMTNINKPAGQINSYNHNNLLSRDKLLQSSMNMPAPSNNMETSPLGISVEAPNMGSSQIFKQR